MTLTAALALALVGGFVLGLVLRPFLEGNSDGTGVSCDAPEASTPQAPSPVADFAPLVFLRTGEKFRPLPVDCYLQHASLGWKDSQSVVTLKNVGDIDAHELGAGGYEHSAAPPCLDSCTFTTGEHTRPFDAGRRLTDGFGFFLDVKDAYRVGERPEEGSIKGVPVYYEFEPGKFVTYWFFYGYSAPGGLLQPGGNSNVSHEADWERISIHLSAFNSPVEVGYYQHSGPPQVVPWTSVLKAGTHLLVFSGQGSHASYPNAGRYVHAADIAGAGLLWWTPDVLVDARAQAWYGYGGAWGRVGRIADTTGPLGPSAYKQAAPCAWQDGC